MRSTGVGNRDVKYVWEANRLQILHPLAASIAEGTARATAASGLGLCGRGRPPIALSRGELGLRDRAGASPDEPRAVRRRAGPEPLSPEDRGLVRRLVAAHANHLAGVPLKILLGQQPPRRGGSWASLAGWLAPDLPARGLEAEGRRILETEALAEILPDGVWVEQSPTYQAFTMEMLALGVLLADEAGRPLNTGVKERLAAGAEHCSGCLPRRPAAPSAA